MKINIEYLDNEIIIENDSIPVIEIENKIYFYKLIKALYLMMNGEDIEDIKVFDEASKEIKYTGRIQVFINYFDFQLYSKRYENSILKYISNETSKDEKNNIVKYYQQLQKAYKKILNEIDLPLTINMDTNFETISKMMKLGIKQEETILENILLIIDLERILAINKILFFVNLKQYLSKAELSELYKYSLYNGVKIVLIDSQSYGTTEKYEKKLIVDNNLDEFMLK